MRRFGTNRQLAEQVVLAVLFVPAIRAARHRLWSSASCSIDTFIFKDEMLLAPIVADFQVTLSEKPESLSRHPNENIHATSKNEMRSFEQLVKT